MKKILFFIPTLMHGGAEKVLVNLVNNLDNTKFDVTVQTIFDEGVHKKRLNKSIKYKYIFKNIFKGSSTIFKLFSPKYLYKKYIVEEYDIAISYLEGPTARILSGCPFKDTKKVSWIHIELNTKKMISGGFRSYNEAIKCYNTFDKIICVSETVKQVFVKNTGIKKIVKVLYNTNETDDILIKSLESVDDIKFSSNQLNICSVGKLVKTKGYDRLAKVHKRLINEGLLHNIYILGIGEDRHKIKKYLQDNEIENTFKLMGFKENPYKYVSECDLFICSSIREGFSTSATESLIVGTPVISTLCSGAHELLGYNDEFGLVVENSEEGIYLGLKKLLQDKEILDRYKRISRQRGKSFSKEKTVEAVELMLSSLK